MREHGPKLERRRLAGRARDGHAVYAGLGHQAAAAAPRDGGVIVDAAFRRGADVDAFLRFAPQARRIVCEAPLEVMVERALRGDSVSDAGPETIAAELARSGRIDPPVTSLARIQTTRPVTQLLNDLAHTLDECVRTQPERKVAA